MWAAYVLISVYVCYCGMCLCAAWEEMLTDDQRTAWRRRLCSWRRRRPRRPLHEALDGCFSIEGEDVVSMEVII